MKTYLLTVTGKSGRQYGLSFDCEDLVDAEMMVRDCDIVARVDGEKVGELSTDLDLGAEIPPC